VFADGQCCVKQDDREVRIPIEDLAWAVTPQATLASALMAACMKAGVAIVLATRHTPSGLVLPFHRHHRQSVIARLQADAKDFAQEAAPARNGSSQDSQPVGGFGCSLAVMGQRR
jgi:CRISPR/Cas system-associated endonuclease Cas1